MKDVVVERFAAFKKNSEGCVSHFYVDATGNITIGIGCEMADVAHAKREFKATKALWKVKGAPGTAPTEAMIEEDYKAAMAVGSKKPMSDYEKVTKLRLSQVGIIKYTKRKMGKFEATMFEHLSRAQWAEFPADAQFACIAMMWGPGIWPTLVRHYPKLTAAIKAEDFLEAAKHITFPVNYSPKVRAFLNKTYEFCFANAAASMPKDCRKDGKPEYFLNPNLMYWPSKWEYDKDSEIAFESDWMSEKV